MHFKIYSTDSKQILFQFRCSKAAVGLAANLALWVNLVKRIPFPMYELLYRQVRLDICKYGTYSLRGYFIMWNIDSRYLKIWNHLIKQKKDTRFTCILITLVQERYTKLDLLPNILSICSHHKINRCWWQRCKICIYQNRVYQQYAIHTIYTYVYSKRIPVKYLIINFHVTKYY